MSDAALGQLLLHGLAHTPDESHWPLGEESQRFRPPEHRKSARLFEIGCQLGEKLVVRQANGSRYANFAANAGQQLCQCEGRACAVKSRGSGQIEEGFINREGLHQRRHIHHHAAHEAADFGIFRHVGLDDHSLWAKLQCLEHGHGGFHAADAGNVTSCRHNAPHAAANDEGLVGKLRVIALFDCGIEGVAVDVGDRELMQFGVTKQARAATRPATPLIGLNRRVAVAAEARRCSTVTHRTNSTWNE